MLIYLLWRIVRRSWKAPERAVKALFTKIGKDPRHGESNILFRDTIPKKEFEEWSMGYIETTGDAAQSEGYIDYMRDLERMPLDGTRDRRIL